jgi:hypothetical protein
VNKAVLTEMAQSITNVTIKDEAANQRSHEHGWSEPQKYEYESYNAGTREEREAIEALHEVPA